MRGASIRHFVFGAVVLVLIALPGIAQSSPPSNESRPPGTNSPAAVSEHPGQTSSTTDSASTAKYCGAIRGYSADKSALQLAIQADDAVTAAGQEACDKAPASVVEIRVQGQALKDSLKNWKAGDQIIATVDVSKGGTTELTSLQDIQPQVLQVGWWEPGVALFSFPALVVLLTIYSKNVRELLFIGQDGRWSNSTTQISLWFTLWVSAYVATFILRWTSSQHFLGSIATPSALLTLSGLSGLTFAGAKGITANKAAKADQAPAASGLPDGKRNDTKAANTSPADLLKDDNGNFDFGDFQMLVVTLIAVISYSIIAYHFLGVLEARASVSLPDVDGTVLALFGVGQGAYLAKKASTGIDQ
jgi:hypothetical protein